MPTELFTPSTFAPLAIGFFGLGTGYFVWGGQAVFGYPKEDKPDVSQTMGMWALWMPGFMQFITGITLLIGLTWFRVFDTAAKTAPTYMAALAFTAYGIHWFAMAHRRFIRSSPLPDGWMAIAFAILSILGIVVFLAATPNDIPVAIVFIGLTLIYLTEIVTRFGLWPGGGRLVGIWQLLTGIWLMYLTFAVTLNFSINAGWWT